MIYFCFNIHSFIVYNVFKVCFQFIKYILSNKIIYGIHVFFLSVWFCYYLSCWFMLCIVLLFRKDNWMHLRSSYSSNRLPVIFIVHGKFQLFMETFVLYIYNFYSLFFYFISLFFCTLFLLLSNNSINFIKAIHYF